MARPGQRPVSTKTNFQSQPTVPAGQKLAADEHNWMASKSNEPGQNDAWSSVVKFDDEYFPDIYTMTAAITYTIDATNAGTGTGRKDTIIGDGNTITFTGFTIRESDLSHSSNVVTTVANHIYTIVFLRVGAVSEVYLRDTGETVTAPVVPQWQPLSFEIGNVADNIVVLPVDVALDTGSVPAVTAFDIQVDAAPNVVTNVSLATANQVRLTLTTSVTNGQTVTAAYTVPGTNPIRSNATQDNAAAFTATAVTNNTSTWLPTDLGADLLLWLDASTIGSDGSVVDGSNNVTTWADKSGNNYDFDGTGHAPLWDTIDKITFDGVSEYLDGTTHLANFIGKTSGMWAFKLPSSLTTDDNAAVFLADEASSTRSYGAYGQQGAATPDKARAFWNNNTGTANVIDSTNTPVGGDIVFVESNGSSYSIYINNSSETLVVVTGTNNGNWMGDISGLDNIMIGLLRRSTDAFVAGSISQILYTNVITAQQRSDLYNYLSNA